MVLSISLYLFGDHVWTAPLGQARFAVAVNVSTPSRLRPVGADEDAAPHAQSLVAAGRESAP